MKSVTFDFILSIVEAFCRATTLEEAQELVLREILKQVEAEHFASPLAIEEDNRAATEQYQSTLQQTADRLLEDLQQLRRAHERA